MARLVAAVVAMALLAAGCGADESSAGASQTGLAHGLVRCDPDASLPSAPEDWYRDTPRYVGNEQPVEQVRAWAMGRPGFQEIWVDRDHNGWITVAFSDSAEDRQRELEREFPDVGVVAVGVDWDLAELRGLQQRVASALSAEGISAGISASLWQGKVEVDLGLLSEANLAVLAPFADEPLCVNGRDPAGAVTGPQIDGGDGWRLLVIDGTRRRVDPDATAVVRPPTPGGVALGTRIEIATNEQQWTTAWSLALQSIDSGLAPDTARPGVDFDTEIVVLGSQLESGSCPELLTGVEVEAAEVRIDLQVSDEQVSCTSDGNPLTWAVAVERRVLPAPPFAITGPASLAVDDDLRPPGASVGDDRTVARPGRQQIGLPGFEPDPRGPGVVTAPTPVPADSVFPHIIEPGFPSTLDVPVECLVGALGPVNGFVWAPEPDEALPVPPDDWLVVATAAGRIPLELSLTADPAEPTLDLTANGVTISYIVTDAGPVC